MITTSQTRADVAVIGAGIIGIAVAYFLVSKHGFRRVLLIDPRDPMSLTSSKSGENYRNWWPHPVMTAFTNHSTDLMEAIAAATGNRINMTRRGYALVTRRADLSGLIAELHVGYGNDEGSPIRIHDTATSASYLPPISAQWDRAPGGVDVLSNAELIRKTFPSYARDVTGVLHIRRAGSISGQQLGQFMLEAIREAGGSVLRGELEGIDAQSPFSLRVLAADGRQTVRADRLVNAAGPFLKRIAAMLGEDIPVSCIYQQKIAFEDRAAAIPRDMPFSIDLDSQEIAWTDEERAILADDPATARLLAPMRGGVHCRPDGAESGQWIKLGWAFNDAAGDPAGPEPIDEQFPDIVLRGASRLNASLAAYVGRLPRGVTHYGGYYPMTPENWPLIGPMRTPGAFLAGAVSGFGTMAACATGEICADWIAGVPVPDYAQALSLSRYDNAALMAELSAQNSKGVL